jgi:hypothetical protein
VTLPCGGVRFFRILPLHTAEKTECQNSIDKEERLKVIIIINMRLKGQSHEMNVLVDFAEGF